MGALALALGLAVGPILAIEPPPPGALETYRQDGTLGRRLEFARQLGNHRVRPEIAQRTWARLQQASGVDPGLAPAPLPAWRGMPTKGTNRIPVLLIDFPDHIHVNDSTLITSKLFGSGTPGEFPRESLRSYYLRSSYNQLSLQGTTLGWYRMQHDRAWYTTTYGEGNSANRAIILEAVQAFDAAHDFSQYDNDGDGEVDYLAVLWAGPDNGWANFWWGYQSELFDPITVDGVQVKTFTWQWESNPVGNSFRADVIIHETGHALGLPDYYDYNSGIGPDGGVGGLDMMAGNYADHNAFSKFMLEWLSPVVISSAPTNFTLRASAQFPDMIAIMPGYSGATPYAEYFMVENRHRVNNDTGNPSDGMLLWHVDARPNGSGDNFLFDNSYSEHKLLRLMEADGLEEIEVLGYANAGDYYNQGDSFTPYTSPNSRAYGGTNTDVTVRNISADGLVMTAVCGIAAQSPLILVQPRGRSVLPQDSVGFHVVAQGSDPLTFQWRKNGADLSGATNPVLFLAPVTVGDSGTYSVAVRNPLGTVISADAVLSVTTALPLAEALDTPALGWSTGGHAPWITQTAVTADGLDAASSGVIGANQESWIETTVSGPAVLTFRWQVSSETNHDFFEFHLNGVLQAGRISGEVPWQQRTLPLGSGTHVLRWRWVKDGGGNGNQDRAWLDQVSVSSPVAPTITIHPFSQSGGAGTSLTLDVSATGSRSLSYQWRRNGQAVGGATNAIYRINNLQSSHTGNYSVIVSNSAGTATSSNAALTVYENWPFINSPPQHQSVALGGSAHFGVTATGSEPLRYQWEKDGADVTGATNAIYLIGNVQASHTGTYRVRVSNNQATTTSSKAYLFAPSLLTPRGTWPGSFRGSAEDVDVVGNYAYAIMFGGGLAIFDVSNPANPVRLGGYETNSYSWSIQVVGRYAYSAQSSDGLQIYDVSNPANVVRVGGLTLPTSVNDVSVVGGLAYVAAQESGLFVLDVSNPAAPVMMAKVDTAGSAYAVHVVGNYAYVADWNAGLAVLDVSDPRSPRLVTRYNTAGSANALKVIRQYAYVAVWEGGLEIIDVSDPADPFTVGRCDTGGRATGVHVVGNRAYVADLETGLQVIDVSRPDQPAGIGGYDTGTASNVRVVGQRAYVADLDEGLIILDVSNPASPGHIGSYPIRGYARSAHAAGNLAYLADGDASLQVIDVQSPDNPQRVGSAIANGNALDVQTVGAYAYVADWDYGMRVFNVLNPASPTPVASIFVAGHAWGLQVVEGYVYLATGEAGLQVIDVRNPGQPSWVGSLDTSGFARGVRVAGHYALVADGYAGLQIIDVSNPASPVRVGGLDTPGYANQVEVAGSYALVADDYRGLLVIDLTNPASPIAVGGFDTGQPIQDIHRAGRYAYVASSLAGLWVLDVANPVNPQPVAWQGTIDSANAVHVDGGRVYVTVGSGGLQLFDTLLPTPAFVWREAESGSLRSPMTLGSDPLAYGGQYVFTTVRDAGTNTVDFFVPASGSYVVWCRVLAPNPDQDSFWVSVDGGAEDVYDAAETGHSSKWQWTRVNGRGASGVPLTLDPRVFNLSAGLHSLVLRGRESLTFLDRLLITSDPDFVPADPFHTLTVNSVNPGSGVFVFINQFDTNGLAGGSTPFRGAYAHNSALNVSAPASSGPGTVFQHWLRDGVVWSSNAVVSVALDNDYSLTAVFANTNTNPGLVGYWALDDGNGLTAADRSTAGNHGTLVNGPLWTNGICQGGLSLDGVNDYVTMADHDSLEFAGRSWTISLRVKTSRTSAQCLMEKEHTSFGGVFLVALNRDNAVPGAFSVFTGSGWIDSNSRAVTDGQWHHLAVTFDGTAFRLYHNGVLDRTQSGSGSYQTTSGPLNLGRFATAGVGWYYQGQMDEVRRYNRALSGAEVAGLTSCPTGPVQALVDAAAPGETLLLPAGTYLDNVRIDKTLTLQGSAAAASVVDGHGAGPVFIIGTNVSVSLVNLTLRNGTNCAGSGAGLQNFGELRLTNCVVVSNQACVMGGGIFNRGALTLDHSVVSFNSARDSAAGLLNEGSLVLVSSLVASNTARPATSSGGRGGGIFNSAFATLEASAVMENYCRALIDGPILPYLVGEGGGIYNSGQMVLRGSTVTNNTGYLGGGIANDGTLILTNCTVSGNHGHGVRNFGTLSIHTSRVVNNSTEAINYDFGGGIENFGTGMVLNCLIAGNSAGDDLYFGRGGGIANLAFDARVASLFLSNTTLSANSAEGDGYGGGIYNTREITLANCTVTANRGFQGGGAWSAGTTRLRSSLIGGNLSSAGSGADVSGPFDSLGFNFIQDTNPAVITNLTAQNIYGLDPLLGPLQNNGGPTLTHALLPGSPAIDRGHCSGLTADQRGVTRPHDVPALANAADGCDIGAYEFVNAPPTIAITNPPSGASFAEGAPVTIEAEAQDLDGAIDHVEFLVDGINRGSDADSPFALVITNLAEGNRGVSAIAVDNLGARATSVVVNVTVVKLMRWHRVELSTNGQVRLWLGFEDASPISSARLPRVEILTSTNVTAPPDTWTRWPGTMVLTNGLILLEENSSTPQRFYISREVP